MRSVLVLVLGDGARLVTFAKNTPWSVRASMVSANSQKQAPVGNHRLGKQMASQLLPACAQLTYAQLAFIWSAKIHSRLWLFKLNQKSTEQETEQQLHQLGCYTN